MPRFKLSTQWTSPWRILCRTANILCNLLANGWIVITWIPLLVVFIVVPNVQTVERRRRGYMTQRDLSVQWINSRHGKAED